MSTYLSDVAIIGAGLGGAALGIALSDAGIKVTIFEAKTSSSAAFISGVILTPNGLRVLDHLGILSRIQDRCFKPSHRIFKDGDYKTRRKTAVTDESTYGYRNHRIWRRVLLEEMKKMLAERSIEIHYESKFNGVLSDDRTTGVDFLINEKRHHASLLIGADGIHSAVREYLHPGITPEYTGLVGLLCHIPTKAVKWPEEGFEPNATLQGKPGAIFYISEDPAEETIMVGMQKKLENSREAHNELRSDPDRIAAVFREGYDEWGSVAQSIIDCVSANKAGCFSWPFVKLPHMPTWYSTSGRVLILGDASHGLPPSSGQGINQALEDVYVLTLLLSALNDTSHSPVNGSHDLDTRMTELLEFWKQVRQRRLDAVFEWTTQSTDTNRLPEAERQKLIASGKFKEGQGEDMSWLFRPDLEREVKEWIDRQRQ